MFRRSLSAGCVCLISNPLDIFYFTGLKVSTGKLFVDSEGAHLFVDGRYLQMASARGFVSVSLETKEHLRAFIKKQGVKRILFDSRHVTYFQFEQLEALFPKMVALVPEEVLFRRMRCVKDEKELRAMHKSAKLLWQGYQHIRAQIRIGVEERQLAKAFELFCLEKGAEKVAFEPIVAFGKNSAMPHYRAAEAKLKRGEIILMDLGVILGGYASDMTRVILPKGCDPELVELYAVAREAHAAALSLCCPGTKIGALDAAAREVMRAAKVEPYFVHSLGHGIGLEVHECPTIRSTGEDAAFSLEEGMVITIEPGLYLPGKGGVRYEDTIVITKGGYKNFYPETP